jgi:hypothetical protein
MDEESRLKAILDEESRLKAILDKYPLAVQDGPLLSEKRLNVLFELGMPSDVDRVRLVVKDCKLYDPRFKGYSIEIFGIKATAEDEPGKTPLLLPVPDEENGEPVFLAHVWLKRIGREGIKSVVEEIWSPTEGWLLLAVSTPDIPDKERIDGLKNLVSGLLITNKLKRRTSIYTLEDFKQDAYLALEKMATVPRRTGKKNQRRSPQGFNIRYLADIIDRSHQTVYEFLKEPGLRKDLEDRFKTLLREKNKMP